MDWHIILEFDGSPSVHEMNSIIDDVKLYMKLRGLRCKDCRLTDKNNHVDFTIEETMKVDYERFCADAEEVFEDKNLIFNFSHFFSQK